MLKMAALVRCCCCTRRCVWVWLLLLYAGTITVHAQPRSGCPFHFSGLDLTSTIAACANASYGSCCDHSKALVAIAMSQYTRTTNNLHLPPHLLQPCIAFIASLLKDNDIVLPVASWCALNASVLADSPCRHQFTDVRSIHELPGFRPVEVACRVGVGRAGACGRCLHAQARFHGTVASPRRISESWNACADAVFLAVASLGDEDFAMATANCFFGFEAPEEMFLPQSRCPVTLQPNQITSIAKSCSASSITKYPDNCCASALLELRISLTRSPPTSRTFSVSEKQGAACLHDITSALLTLGGGAQEVFQACNVLPEEVFHTSTHGCHGISTMGKVQSFLVEHPGVDHISLYEACNASRESCEPCRRAALDAAFVVASKGGSESVIKAKGFQGCSDVVFLALARKFTKEKASEIGSCLYSLPDTIDDPALPPESRVPSNTVVAPPRVVPPFTRLVTLLGISFIGTTLLLAILLIMLVVTLQWKGKDAFCCSEEKPLTGKARMKNRHFRKDGPSPFTHIRFPEIQRATDNFSTIIGRGGLGTVYKARFQDGLVAVVKRMNKGAVQGGQEFGKEVELLGRLHHRHLVTLRGFCAERHERLLVYEYCENGSLKEHLHHDGHVKQGLTWQRRLQIALDVATGLEYLHSYCEPPLCHRDIKSSNVLLDENFCAKIADFGLARVGRKGSAKLELATTEVRGTPGYVDPEYVRTQELTEKSDVYSFGVLLLELITARRAITDDVGLVDWAHKFMDNDSKLALIVDSDLQHVYSWHDLKTLIAIVKRCTQSDGRLRPTMRQVVRLFHDLSPLIMDSSSRSSAHSRSHST